MKKALWVSSLLIGLLLVTVSLSNRGLCRRPLPWVKDHCRRVEESILAATVRVELHGWIEIDTGYDVERITGSSCHATVFGGRYLITHNHFGVPLTRLELYNRHANGAFTGISVFRLDGTEILEHAPLDAFSVVSEQNETVILDFGQVDGVGVFSRAGVESAPIAHSGEIRIRPGAEVAQIDCDTRGNTRVVWTTVHAVTREKGVPLLRANHRIKQGASGGGVFLNGTHIGNNWGRVSEFDRQSGLMSQARTFVALNPTFDGQEGVADE